MASMYVAMLRMTPDMEAGDEPDYDIYIGRSRWRYGCVSYRVGSALRCTDGAWSRLSRCLIGLVTGNERAGLL